MLDVNCVSVLIEQKQKAIEALGKMLLNSDPEKPSAETRFRT